jgi:hypothetical protein
MKAWRIGLIALLITGGAAAFAMRAPDGVSVTYSPAFDSACAALHAERVEDAWKAELTKLLPEYLSAWHDNGPKMLSVAEALTGIQRPKRARVHLTLCSAPSRSFLGTSVNMRFALKSYTQTPVPLRYKQDVQFHELLHLMLDDRVPAGSKMLSAMKGATSCVRNHVHLLALQKAVLIELKQEAALADVIRIDSLLPNDCYRVAWAVVNEFDTKYRDYVSDLTE